MLSVIRARSVSFTWIKEYATILAGSAIMACGYVLFIVPHKIVPGGIYGVAIIIHHLSGLPTGLLGLVLNLPLLIWGWIELGPRFGIKTVFGLVATSLFIDVGAWLYGSKPLTEDLLLSSLFGGVAIGLGLALVFRAKGTTGGTDIVANIMARRFGTPIGRSLLMIDALVVIFGIIAFSQINVALYAIVCIFATARVLDGVLEGLKYRKVAMIVSQQVNEIRNELVENLNRGGTVFWGQGIYRGQERPMLMTALTRRELVILEERIHAIDPKAFVMVFDAREILGEGFMPLRQE